MAMQLDHAIVPVNDADASTRFYVDVLGFANEGDSPPFTVVRVSPDLTLQLAPWGTDGNMHLAFAMEPDEFDDTFARIRDAGVAYGDSYDAAENMRGPGIADGAHGDGDAIYLMDPNRHLIELRCYRSR